ncbi:MAG: hypothetical protein LBG95_04345 [Treponema sp.]|jgi:hypothetical protein|nr:hypothetical protein [Treponema sp.]
MKLRLLFFLFLPPVLLPAAPLYSPTWGFWLDLPEGYEYVEGNNVDRYSFQGPQGGKFDIAVYNGVYQDAGQLSGDIKRRLGNTGDTSFFEYGDKAAVLMELNFGNYTGWGLCVELGKGTNGKALLMAALAYAPDGKKSMELYHLSALDSLAPSEKEKRLPGPIMEFSFPRGGHKEAAAAGTALRVTIRENDAEAAQALIEREFALLADYQNAPNWQDAWIRYYRAICRDSRDRLSGAVPQLIQNWNKGPDKRAFAEKALAWVQGFVYERDLSGSDFVNLVSALTEGRGDCDSRAMLWAMILMEADIPAAMMVSRDYSHAMGLADIAGSGARFEAGGVKWLVAETTAQVGIGLISQDTSDSSHWLGILFN